MCNTPAEEIKNIMLRHGLSYQWLADRMNTYYQKIQYALDIQKEMPLSTYTAIMEILEKHGFIENSADSCSSLVQMAFKTNAKFGDEIKKINDEISEDIKDDKFTPDERLRLRFKLQDLKKEINESLDKLIKLTEH